MTHQKLTAALLAVCLLLLSGCSNAGSRSPVSMNSHTPAALISPYGEPDPAAEAVAAGANQFAFRLSAELVAAAPDENFVCSPYSAWLPLAALLSATNEVYREELLDVLGAQGVDAQDVGRAASRMLYSLTNQRELEYDRGAHNPLQIANAIFVSGGETLQDDFARTFADAFRGQAMAVDFSSSEAVDAVNAWASEQTDGLIPEIVEEFDQFTVAAIANAIYFSDRWDWEFNPSLTEEGVFYAPSGETTAQYMRRESVDLVYYEDDRLQAMPLRFRSGGTLYILLPRDGDAAGLLASMDADYFAQIRQDAASATGKLLLPRFRIESGVMELNDALETLGVPLFDMELAPLSDLIEEAPAYLSTAVQKAVIEVDEKGTTAAAVTVMAAAGSAEPEPTAPFEMICERPFVFLLCENTYDGGAQVLFTGVVNRPESD